MGQAVQQESFSQSDRNTFKLRLHEQLAALRDELTQSKYSQGPSSLGAELELYLIDEQGYPLANNQKILSLCNNSQFQPELNRFNLEFNLAPVMAKGAPFLAMEQEMQSQLTRLKETIEPMGTYMASIGILPTLQAQHLGRSYMTDLPRYRALARELSGFKGEPFEVHITGKEELEFQSDEVTLEGANTSFQLHFKVPADRFADYYNAAQLITPLVMSVAGNSPLFLGKKLWQETRIALFKQAIDNRVHGLTQWRQPARVCFGHGWVREGAWELFAENVAMHPVLLPYVDQNETPFAELQMHHGTVWNWNRAVFQPGENGHLRIEYRTLPAGPTYLDMMANSALAIGLTQSLMHNIDEYLPRLPFGYGAYNFYRTAQLGLDAHILWPKRSQDRPREVPVHRVLLKHLDSAAQGLQELGIDGTEIDRLLGIIEQRIATRRTGAKWQLYQLAHYEQSMDREQALQAMLKDYLRAMNRQVPVAQWQVGDLDDH